MRRSDREVTAESEKLEIIKKCKVCRVAFSQGNLPYIVPMNFGFDVKDKTLTLYFHSAMEGKKIEIIKENPNVCFEMDCSHRLITSEKACGFTYDFESIVGSGVIEIVSDLSEKIDALAIFMRNYSDRQDFDYYEKELKNVCILKLKAGVYTGKRSLHK